MVNFANCDMVGHTGIMEAAIKAVNTVDCVLSKAIPLAYELGYNCLITADHGNAEQMVDDETRPSLNILLIRFLFVCSQELLLSSGLPENSAISHQRT